MRRLAITSLALALCLSSSACLKSRYQVRDDQGGDASSEEGPSQPVPNKVQDVEPKGGYAIDEMKGEMTRMNGRIEDLERSQKQSASNPSNATKDDVKKLEQRIQELENAQAQMIEQLKKMQDSPAMAPDPSEFLSKAKDQLEAGQLDEAIDNLGKYLSNPKATKVEEATFLRAEAYFQLKQYKKAIVDYSKFPEKFTRSSRMPEALYKIGLSFDALGMKDDAKGFFQELVEKYPKSPEAKRVKKKSRAG